MKQDKLLHLIADKITEITGNTYVVDYIPHRNISEQSTMVYRCVTPGSLSFDAELRTRYPQLHQSVSVLIFAVPSPDKLTQNIIKYQNEITDVLQEFVSRGKPISLTDGKYRATVIAGESEIPFDSGVALSGLADDPPVCIASITLTFLLA